MSKWLSTWQGIIPRAQQKWITLKTVECSVCQEKYPGAMTDLVLERRKNETNASPHLFSFPFVPSEVKQSLGPCCCSLCSHTDIHHTVSIYQSHKPCSHLGLLSFCSSKRNHTRKSWNNFLLVVMCTQFHISVTQLRHFLCAFYLWAQSTAINQSQETQETSLSPVLQRDVTRSWEHFSSLQMVRIQECIFPTLFSPHRLCPLHCLTHHRLWTREKQDTQERFACKGQNWNTHLQ